MQMKKKEALSIQENLSPSDIIKSIESYYTSREKETTTKKFKYKNKYYPSMNIIKIAIEIFNEKGNKQIDSKGYNNITACEETLQKHFKNEIVF